MIKRLLPILLAFALVVCLPFTAFANTSIVPAPFTSVTRPLLVEWEISLPSSSSAPDCIVFHDNASTVFAYEQLPAFSTDLYGRYIKIYEYDGFSYEDPNITTWDSTYLRYYSPTSFTLTSACDLGLDIFYNPVDSFTTMRVKPFTIERQGARFVISGEWAERYETDPPQSYQIPVAITAQAHDTEGNVYTRYHERTFNGPKDNWEARYILDEARALIPEDKTFAYYTLEVSSSGMIPTLGTTTSIVGGSLLPDSVTIDGVLYDNSTIVDYSDFDLLAWLGTALDGFMGSTLFVVGDVTVTIGMLVGSVLGFSVFIAFLKKFAGG